MLPVLNLASQLNRNLHFNHFLSVWGSEYVQGQGWGSSWPGTCRTARPLAPPAT